MCVDPVAAERSDRNYSFGAPSPVGAKGLNPTQGCPTLIGDT